MAGGRNVEPRGIDLVHFRMFRPFFIVVSSIVTNRLRSVIADAVITENEPEVRGKNTTGNPHRLMRYELPVRSAAI